MGLDALSDALPPYARDTRLNLGSVLTTGSVLTEQQRWGTALAVAVAAGNPRVLAEISEAASDKLSEAAFTAATALTAESALAPA
jgi:alkyl hydroperoxide reductase subunit D